MEQKSIAAAIRRRAKRFEKKAVYAKTEQAKNQLLVMAQRANRQADDIYLRARVGG